MNHNYLAFDIEIEKLIPNGTKDWNLIRPLGISCAATMKSGEEPITWYSKTESAEIADRMSREDLHNLLLYLIAETQTNGTILTWNGLGFDFDILAEESGEVELCQNLALEHIDMMFHFFCLNGYALGLDKAARGMGLPGKTPGMSGEMAPLYWAQGRREEVLGYVSQDVRTTLALAEMVDLKKEIRWASTSGRQQIVPLPDGWMTVNKALSLPLPDTSWMRSPWHREKFFGWLNK